MRIHLPAFALVLAACGGEPAPATPPPQPTEAPVASAAPAPPPQPTASAAPSASASAAPAKPAPKSGGGLLMVKSDPAEVSDTFSTNQPAKIELGDKDLAVLRIPSGALGHATNITFKLDPRGKSQPPMVGKLYRLMSVIAPSTTPEPKIDTNNGEPFVLELPAGARKEANLAIGVEDEKGKVKWTIVAPKRIDDVRNVAVYELTALPSAWLHVTTKAPTAK